MQNTSLLPKQIPVYMNATFLMNNPGQITTIAAGLNCVASVDPEVHQYSRIRKSQIIDFSLSLFIIESDGTIVASNSVTTYSGSLSFLKNSCSSKKSLSDDAFHLITISVSGDKLMDKNKKRIAEKLNETESRLHDKIPVSNE